MPLLCILWSCHLDLTKQAITKENTMKNRWYEDDYNDDRGGNDEYYESYCPGCNEKTEHDVCTDECVECGG